MDVYELTLDAINRNLTQLNTTSQNIANVNTPGYIRSNAFSHQLNGQVSVSNSMELTESKTKETSRDLDIAILGNGFFQIQQNGEITLTRNGHFYIGKDSYLRHSSGGFLIGERGPIVADLNSTELTPDGSVLIGGNSVDRIQVVEVSSVDVLQRMPNNLYKAPMSEILPVQAQLKPKSLNVSNVDSSHEMVRMIELGRKIQTSQKVINAYDQLLNVGINELGKK